MLQVQISPDSLTPSVMTHKRGLPVIHIRIVEGHMGKGGNHHLGEGGLAVINLVDVCKPSATIFVKL